MTQVGVLEPKTQLLINGILQCFNIVIAMGSCFFVERVGRRLLFLASTSGMFLVFIGWTTTAADYAINKTKASRDATIVMIFLYYMFYNIAFSGLLVGYGVEILPFNIRAKVMFRWSLFDLTLG